MVAVVEPLDETAPPAPQPPSLPLNAWRAPPAPLPPPLAEPSFIPSPYDPDEFAALRAASFDASPARRRRRRWPVVLLLLVAAAIAYVGAAAGMASATADAADRAAAMTRQGQYAQAIALEYRIAALGGPLQFLDRSDVTAAPREAGRSMLAWATALASAGNVDSAVALIGSVTDPSLATQASRERASLLLQAATLAAQRGDYVTAVQRAQQLMASDSGSPQSVAVGALLPDYEVGEAAALVATGHGSDAVAILDAVMAGAPAEANAKAEAAYPAALLSAGREQLATNSYIEARATLQRLVSQYPRSAEAQRARPLLSAGQPVSGTLVDRSGHPIAGRVRLSSHFTALPGAYFTSGPFFYSSADARGDFLFSSVPVGGPYVLEVFHNGGWTTLVDPGSGQPADPVTVKPLEPAALAFIVLPE